MVPKRDCLQTIWGGKEWLSDESSARGGLTLEESKKMGRVIYVEHYGKTGPSFLVHSLGSAMEDV